ncbi:MAG: GNAT family N-acetyltransferase [Desulfomonilia bacterium]
MREGEETKACSLVEKVFNEFVAPDYDEEGIEEFFKFAHPLALARRAGPGRVVIVAEQGPELAGIIEMLDCEHIAMLFVSLRGRGIAKELISMAIEECRKRRPGLRRITVNSSPFAVPVYERMGFRPTGPFQKKNGIIFKPMARDLD